MTRGTGRVGERLELALSVRLGLRGLADAEELVLGTGNLFHGAENLDFLEAVVDRGCEFGDCF